ncbi:MAG TPA: sn-glycerol-3-phosphate ABC transporter ATP-binding protein UgpC [Acetobacteraceae bacterium]|nr:sn-glycerol-3-phosphate ABC transporter ATP-binding protein UgpC [Acetobacteraceae bacterium]
MDGQGNVSLRGVAVAYGPIRVFDRLDLEVAQSEFLVLLGPSGCGKSTLLNAIAGLTEIDDGEIWIGGRNVTWHEPKDRGIAMVFQSYALYPRMNVRGNLSFGLKVARTPRAEIERRVRTAAEMLQIADLLDRRPAALSGGQRQRVAIGRALVRDAGVFLFDEPLSNLDAQLRSELRVEIKRLHQRLGATMIYVTHDQIEALTLADRIAVMKDRTFQQIGTPQEIYLRPANRFVATFVGSPAMNFVPGRIECGSDGPVFQSPSLRLKLPNYPFVQEPANASPVELGIRPEHVIVASDADDAQEVSVEMSEPMGSDLLAWTRLGDLPLSIRLPAETRLTPGDRLRILLPEHRSNLFDATSGARL